MPESAAEIHARAAAAAGADGRLPAPDRTTDPHFAWEVVDGRIVPRALPAPSEESPRHGEASTDDCPSCRAREDGRVLWENERWVVTRPVAPGGLPLTVFLESREHLDLTDLDDALASELGRISVWLTRIISHLPHVARCHVHRWGDGNAHLHLWFMARPEGLPALRGAAATDWDAILPPPAEDVWLADLATVAAKLANHDGRARV